MQRNLEWEEKLGEKYHPHRRSRDRPEGARMNLKGKRVIVIGERDGVQGPALAEAVRAAGGQVVLERTECFV